MSECYHFCLHSDLQHHSNLLGRVSSVSSLNQLLASDDDMAGDAISLGGLFDMASCNEAFENPRFGGMMMVGSPGYPQLADAATSRSGGTWVYGFHTDLSCLPQIASSGARTARGTKRRATSPASAMALRSPGAAQRSPANKKSAHTTPSPLANFGAPLQGCGTNSERRLSRICVYCLLFLVLNCFYLLWF